MSRLVVLMVDGNRLKGFSHDFFPDKSAFHLQLVNEAEEPVETRRIGRDELQAVFFVRDFAFGRIRRYTAKRTPYVLTHPPAAGGFPMQVTFSWGETLQGMAYDYRDDSPGFFLVPTEPPERAYNLVRVYVTRAAVSRLERL